MEARISVALRWQPGRVRLRAGAPTGLLLTLVASAAFPPCGYAQFESARLSGRVTNQDGGVVVGAQVELTNVDTSVVLPTTTNAVGLYAFPALKPGNYLMNVRAERYRAVSVTGIVVNVQENVARNFELQLGSMIESTSIAAEGASAITLDPAVSIVVDRTFVENMPLNGRSFQSLLTLTPGLVMSVATPTDQGQFSVNGQRTNANYFMVDGVGANFGSGVFSMGTGFGGTTAAWSITGGTNSLVSVDAMQEFRVQTSTYAPEFGRTAGGQISIVTRSGANDFHGTLFDYFRHDELDARNFFNPAPNPKPELRQHDFGGTLGGPIVPNETFFFFSYEGLRLQQPLVDTAPFLTAEARRLVADIWRPYVDSTPIPNGEVGPSGLTAMLTMATSLPVIQDATALRIDHSLTDRVSLFGRYNHAPSKSVAVMDRFLSATRTDNVSNVDTATFGATFTFGATKLNDLRVNWSRNDAGSRQYSVPFYGAVVPSESDVLPPGLGFETTQLFQFGVVLPGDSYAVPMAASWGALSDNLQQQINIVDTFSWMLGTHGLKFGFDWRRLSPRTSFAPNSIGISASWDDLQAGTVTRLLVSGAGRNRVRSDNYSLFVQDTWRASNRLTLTYGARWDVNTAPVSTTENPLYAVTGVFDAQPLGVTAAAAEWRTRYTNVAPRFGMAYQLTPKTVVRGGGGVFSDVGAPSALSRQVAVGFPYYRNRNTMRGVPYTFSDPSQFMAQPVSTTVSEGFAATVAIDPGLKTPRTYQWSITAERELFKNQAVSVAYVGAKGHDLLHYGQLQPTTSGIEWLLGSVRNAGRSRYDSLQVSYRWRMSKGLQALASYTLSKSMDNGSSDISTDGGIQGTKLSDLDPEKNWGYSTFDVRHSFSGAVSYEIPTPLSLGRVGRTVLGGWALDGLVNARSGQPVDIFAAIGFLNGVGQWMRPNVVPGEPLWIADSSVPGGRRLNSAAFSVPAVGTPGNLARNSVRDFPLYQLDLALRRRFHLTDRITLDLRAEYFNIFNTTNLALHPYARYLGGLAGYKFGVAAETQNTHSSGSFYNNQGGGFSTQYGMGGPRSGQLALKLGF